ncbi:MAG: type III toxin-antitoxin system ToxN/AbiQ family toxin [Oscillospiraceae bacterium]|nr:type III toxin-antitoxin system ToxN/AbiQ family toxin [Oscillospiraceae bacterium]
MDIEFNDIGIYTVDVPYLKYLHDVDSEVFYSPNRYETKPFLGIIIGIGDFTYFVPFSSSKPKHLNWRNSSRDYFLIYEIVNEDNLSPKAMRKPDGNGKVKHIIAVLDLKKMIPVPAGLYHRVNFSEITDTVYRGILEKEYRFCLSIRDKIATNVSRIYSDQKNSGIIRPFYCNFSKLEEACKKFIR